MKLNCKTSGELIKCKSPFKRIYGTDYSEIYCPKCKIHKDASVFLEDNKELICTKCGSQMHYSKVYYTICTVCKRHK